MFFELDDDVLTYDCYFYCGLYFILKNEKPD